MSPIKSLGNSRAKYNYKFGLTGLEAADPYVPPGPVYVDDIFSTYVETATTDQPLNIDNGIDFATHGGLIWLKRRNGTAGTYTQHVLIDTERNADTALLLPSNTRNQVLTGAPNSSSFDSDGFTWGSENNYHPTGADYVSWSFRKQPGFLDIVTYEGDGNNGKTIPHSLGSTPGFVIIKRLDVQDSRWICWHRSTGTAHLVLSASEYAGESYNNYFTVDASNITINSSNATTNIDGSNYIAYIFAHDDQRFGTDRDESIIKCGSWTTDSSTGDIPEVDLGWEPQFMLWKASTTTSDWYISDSSRGWLGGSTIGGGSYNKITANTNGAESHSSGANNYASGPLLTSTGFVGDGANWGANQTYIYIAVRRPNKPKTVGTDVFTINTRNGTGSNTSITNIGFNPDLVISKTRTSGTQNNPAFWYDRLRGNFRRLISGTPNADTAESGTTTGMKISGTTDKTVDIVQLNNINRNGDTNVDWMFRRAPGFFDIVAAQGTSTGKSDWSHSLGVAPELIFRKSRDNAYTWHVWSSSIAGDSNFTNNSWSETSGLWQHDGTNTNMTATTFSTSGSAEINSSSDEFITYLFASLPGVSKIGTYTNGSTSVDQNIDCGFNSPARFVMIKRYDSGMTAAGQGNWGVWDTARGIGTGNDSYLLLNLDDAEVTGFNDISEYASGFTVNAEGGSASTSGWWNVVNASYIYLAIA